MVEVNIKYQNIHTNDIVTVVSIKPSVIPREEDTIELSDGKKWDEKTFLNHHKKIGE